MAGIYIHIPFCKKKCTYCDFHFSTNFSAYRSQLIRSLVKEIQMRKNELLGEKIETIYFGGGTPSLLFEEELNQILEILFELHEISQDLEISLEANPDDITEEKVKFWKKAGINRLSIGIQSFDEEDLLWMNRAHNSHEALNSVILAQENGITNISIDLIYGLPEMDLKRWEKQVNKAIDLDVKHISAYCLTVEEKTQLHKLVKDKKLLPSDNETQAKHFELLQKRLKESNFIQYEISNFGKENFSSKHNSSYWKGEKYQGIGPSAHSFDQHSRSWNIANNSIYIKEIQAGVLPSKIEMLSQKDQFNELLLTGLRTIWGVSLVQLNEIFSLNETFHSKINELIKKEEALLKNDSLILTEKGMLFADAIAMDFFIA